LLELINDVLDFSKIEAGQMTLSPANFELNKLVVLTVEELRCLAESKKLSLRLNAKLHNSVIFNDQNIIRRILSNLVSNAIKFTEVGGVCIDLKELNPSQIAITVKDTGIGIAQENQQSIFEAFRQVDQSLTRQHHGSGLGLAITKSLVEMLQGVITVESQLGKGSVFTVVINRNIND
jgi:signal transduction histidine kinase